MSKIFKNINIVLLIIGALIFGLYLSNPVFDFIFSQDRFGLIISRPCDILGFTNYDTFDKSCYHAICCEPVMVYFFYLFLILPISLFLFYKKQKLLAMLFSAFGVGIIVGTFIFYLVMP